MKEKLLIFGIIIILVIICIYLIYQKRKETFQTSTSNVMITFNQRNNTELSVNIPTSDFNNINPMSFDYLLYKIADIKDNLNKNSEDYKNYLKYLFNVDPYILAFYHDHFRGSSKVYYSGESSDDFIRNISSFKIGPYTKLTYIANGDENTISNNTSNIQNVDLDSPSFPVKYNDKITRLNIEMSDLIKSKEECVNTLKMLYRKGTINITNIQTPSNYLIETRYNNNKLKYISNENGNNNSIKYNTPFKHIRLLNINDGAFKAHNFIFKFTNNTNNTNNLYMFMPVCEFNLSGGSINHLFDVFNLYHNSFNNYKLQEIITSSNNNDKYIFNISGVNYKVNTLQDNDDRKSISNIKTGNIECMNMEDSVILYTENNYKGSCKVLKPSNYNQNTLINRNYSSIKINGSQLKCKIYQNNNYTGNSIELLANVERLSELSNTPNNFNFNNNIGSIKVYFKDENYKNYNYLVKQLDWSPYINNPYIWSLKCKKYKNLIKLDYRYFLENVNLSGNTMNTMNTMNTSYLNSSYSRIPDTKKRCPMIEEVLAIRQNKRLTELGGSASELVCGQKTTDFKGDFDTNFLPQKWNKKTDDEIIALIEQYYNNDASYTNYKSVNLGCYQDNIAGKRDLSFNQTNSNRPNNALSNCRQQCKNSYDLMAIQYNNECYCDNTRKYNFELDTNSDDKQCSHNEDGEHISSPTKRVGFRNRIFYQNVYLENLINTIKQFRLLYKIYEEKDNFLSIQTNNTESKYTNQTIYKTIRYWGSDLVGIQVEDELTNNLEIRLHSYASNKVILWDDTQLDIFNNNGGNKINISGVWKNVIIPPNTSIINYNSVNNSSIPFFGKPSYSNVLRTGKHVNQSLKSIRIIHESLETESSYTRDKLCPSSCMGSNVSNDKSNNYQNNYFTVDRTSSSNISIDGNILNIASNNNYGICGDYLTNNVCSTTKQINSIDCRTCNIPVEDNDIFGNDKFCPNICYNKNKIYGNESNIMEDDGDNLKVCNKYISLNEKDLSGDKYLCHTGNNVEYSKHIDCTNCRISGNQLDKRNVVSADGFNNTINHRNPLKNFMNNPDTFLNTDNKKIENFQTTNILGVVLSGANTTSSTDYIQENQIQSSNSIYFPQLDQDLSRGGDINNARRGNVVEIRNISRNKLFGIYSFNNMTLYRTTYPYNIPGFISDEPNVVLGPNDKLFINNITNIAVLNGNITSRTLSADETSTTGNFHTDFTPSSGFNIRQIKIIDMPDNCKYYNLDQSNCTNQIDTAGNKCRFILANKLDDNSGLESSLLTKIEEEQEYNPLREELNMYKTLDKTLDKNNTGQKYTNVGAFLDDRPQNSNFCFSIDLTNTDVAVPYSGICTTRDGGGTAEYPCVKLTTKNSDGDTTNFIRHRDATINELGAEIREFVLHNPGTIQQNINTLSRIFDVNTEIKNEIEADQLIEKQLLASNQEELNNIRNNLMKEIQQNKAIQDELSSNEPIITETFTNNMKNSTKKPIRRITSNYNNENLTVMKNADDTFGIKINENCLSVYGENDYDELKCNSKSSSQKFYEHKIRNNSDAKIVMGETPLPTTKNNYPYSVFKSGVTGNCLQINNEGVSIEPCNPNSEKQKWSPFTDPYKCLDSR